MDERLARSVADELVKVVKIGGDCWVVSFRAEIYDYKLMYDREEVAGSLGEALRLLAITAIKRYNGASHVSGPGKKESPPVPPGEPMPDLFAGELEAMSKVLDRVSGLLGEEARRLVDLRQATANLAAEADEVVHSLPAGSLRDRLQYSLGTLAVALAALSKE